MIRPPDAIQTRRLNLRLPVLEDVESIFTSYACDPEVLRYINWLPHKDLGVTKAFVADCILAWRDGNRFPYVITEIGKDLAIGMIELRLHGHKADVGYVLAREYWGRGYTTEALKALIGWCFAEPEIYRIWAVCDVENVSSARVMEKVGMTREGILRREMLHPNISPEPRDCYIYAIVK